ncbi:hypothetical protein [Paenibacillus sp. MMO-58]|uniref:hypothetical protein n=1 Tax=Paenibacillus sp. MMO-58 TaxID=3081290 RepID=UPI0030166805
MYTMRIQLLTDSSQFQQLVDVMLRFNEICNFISQIGIETKTQRNKMKLSKECYAKVRESYNPPAQMIVRAVGKVVEAYKSGSKSFLSFGEHTSVVYDTRLLTFKWMQMVSIATFEGRIDIPIQITGYRKGAYDRRVIGLADLILENEVFYLLLPVELPESANINSIEFTEIAI